MGFGARIDNIKITPTALSKIPTQNDPLDIIIWIFDHTNAKGLDLSGCSVGERTVAKIANLERLQILNLSDCTLPSGFLASICNSFSLQKTLLRLDLSHNHYLNFEGTKIIANLVHLEVLSLGCSRLSSGSLVYICNSLKAVLLELDLSGNNLSIEDIKAIAFLAVLQVLNLSSCLLSSGSLLPIGNSPTLQAVLRVLNLTNDLHPDDVYLGPEDIGAIAGLKSLEILKLRYCSPQPDLLVSICGSLKEVLRELDIPHNYYLNPQDTDAIANLKYLEVLKLRYCEHYPGFLVPICNSLKEVLRELDLFACDDLSPDDIGAIASLTALQALNLSDCSFQPSSLVPICNSLKTVLRELDLSYNNDLGPDDIDALALLTALQVLNLSGCELLPNSLVPVCNSLKTVLRELDLSSNRHLSLLDMNALALLSVLQVLNLSNCSLHPNSLVPVCNGLKIVLCKLNLSDNENLGLEDIKAIALLTVLQVLNLSRCSLQPNSLFPVCNSLKAVLCGLDLSHNEHLSPGDIDAITLLTALKVLKLNSCVLKSNFLAPIYRCLILPRILRELNVACCLGLGPKDEKIITEARRFITVMT